MHWILLFLLIQTFQLGAISGVNAEEKVESDKEETKQMEALQRVPELASAAFQRINLGYQYVEVSKYFDGSKNRITDEDDKTTQYRGSHIEPYECGLGGIERLVRSFFEPDEDDSIQEIRDEIKKIPREGKSALELMEAAYALIIQKSKSDESEDTIEKFSIALQELNLPKEVQFSVVSCYTHKRFRHPWVRVIYSDPKAKTFTVFDLDPYEHPAEFTLLVPRGY